MITSYLTVPVSLPGIEIDGTQHPDKTVDCKILPANVIAYHVGFHNGMFIYLTTGQAFCLAMTVPEYEERVVNYWKEVNKRMQNNNKIVTLPGSKHHN